MLPELVLLDMCSEWVCSLNVEQNIAQKTKGPSQKAKKTTMLLPGENTGDGKPQRPQ